ncbi:MAG: hypothetical protein ACLT5P_00595 [Flavonifractor plautii]
MAFQLFQSRREEEGRCITATYQWRLLHPGRGGGCPPTQTVPPDAPRRSRTPRRRNPPSLPQDWQAASGLKLDGLDTGDVLLLLILLFLFLEGDDMELVITLGLLLLLGLE